ncbi:MAG TPA: zinc ribbon domain-containing protein [Blastocatellia bacterium]|nr:zinc ribbon domain-containing protein [Blastocatellia bacterium]
MRRRLRDWPIVVYKFKADPGPPPYTRDCNRIPEVIWEIARAQRELWNQLVACFEAKSQLIPELKREVQAITERPKTAKRTTLATELNEKIKAEWVDLDLQLLTIRKNSRLHWQSADDVFERFNTALRTAFKNPERGFPKARHGIRKVAIPCRFSGGGIPFSDVFGRRSSAFRLDKAQRGHGHWPGVFGLKLGKSDDFTEMSFGAVVHREVPAGAILKKAMWLGSRDIFGWHWSLALTVEQPPTERREPTGRACAIDVGWRKFDDYIRLGVLADTDGNQFELRLPLAIKTHGIRRANKHMPENIPAGWADLPELSRRRDVSLDLLKDQLRGCMVVPELPKELRGTARALLRRAGEGDKTVPVGRDKAAFKLLDGLKRTGGFKEAIERIEQWALDRRAILRRHQALWDRLTRQRDWIYGNIASWMTRNYDEIIREELDLSEIRESDSTANAIVNSKRYQQWAATYSLLEYIDRGAAKSGSYVRRENPAFSTVTCQKCGGQVEQTGKVRLLCENGHAFDQDANAALNFLSLAAGFSAVSEAVIVPRELERFIVRLEHFNRKVA